MSVAEAAEELSSLVWKLWAKKEGLDFDESAMRHLADLTMTYYDTLAQELMSPASRYSKHGNTPLKKAAAYVALENYNEEKRLNLYIEYVVLAEDTLDVDWKPTPKPNIKRHVETTKLSLMKESEEKFKDHQFTEEKLQEEVKCVEKAAKEAAINVVSNQLQWTSKFSLTVKNVLSRT